MIGPDHFGEVRFSQVNTTFMSLWPLWTYAENFMKIYEDLAMSLQVLVLIGWLGHDRS